MRVKEVRMVEIWGQEEQTGGRKVGREMEVGEEGGGSTTVSTAALI